MRPEIDVLVPFHPDSPERSAIWGHNRALWGSLHGDRARVLVGSDPMVGPDRPFSPGRARNRAFEQGSAPLVLCYDSDDLPPVPAQLDEMVDRARSGDGHGWAAAFDGCIFITAAGSRAIVEEGAAVGDVHLAARTTTAAGPTVVSRDLFRSSGGYDERFEGWGFEDTALRRVLHFLAGPSLAPPVRSDCWTMQPAGAETARRRPQDSPNRMLYETYYRPLGSPADVREFLSVRGSFLRERPQRGRRTG
jgi:hypothetical protein